MSERPSSWATFEAFARQGAKELAQALPAFPDSIRVVEEPGTLGNPTSQMVTDSIQSPDTWEQRVSQYADRGVQQQEQEIER